MTPQTYRHRYDWTEFRTQNFSGQTPAPLKREINKHVKPRDYSRTEDSGHSTSLQTRRGSETAWGAGGGVWFYWFSSCDDSIWLLLVLFSSNGQFASVGDCVVGVFGGGGASLRLSSVETREGRLEPPASSSHTTQTELAPLAPC